MKHSVFAKIATLALALVLILSLAACGKKSDSGVKILVPNDTTNEARALLLLQENGIITLKDGDRKSTRLNSSHSRKSRMPSSA